MHSDKSNHVRNKIWLTSTVDAKQVFGYRISKCFKDGRFCTGQNSDQAAMPVFPMFARQSTCALELDVASSGIINSKTADCHEAPNIPSLASIWQVR